MFVTIAVVIAIVAALLAFVKVNGRPFHLFMLNALQTIRRPRLRIWNNTAVMDVNEKEVDVAPVETKPAPKEYYKKSHLAEVALIVDTQGRYKGEQ